MPSREIGILFSVESWKILWFNETTESFAMLLPSLAINPDFLRFAHGAIEAFETDFEVKNQKISALNGLGIPPLVCRRAKVAFSSRRDHKFSHTGLAANLGTFDGKYR